MFHLDDTKFSFNSFAEFSQLNTGHSSATEGILMQYKFLVVPNDDERPQTYNFTIRLNSLAAIQKRFSDGLIPVRSNLFRLTQGTVQATITYEDYTIAKTLLYVIDEWVKIQETGRENKIVIILQNHSHRFSSILKVIVVTSIFSSAWMYLPEYFKFKDENFINFGQFMLLAANALFVGNLLAVWVGRSCENSIDAWQPISYICVNEADKREFERARDQNRKSLLKSICLGVGAFLMSIGSKVGASLFLWYFTQHR